MPTDETLYKSVIVNVSAQMDALSQTFLFDGYQAISKALELPLASCAILFIILTGYGITFGFIKQPLTEFYKFILRLGFIYFFAMNWGNFSSYFVDLFVTASGELGGVLMRATHTGVDNNIIHSLQSVFTEVIELGVWTMRKMSFKNWWPYYTAYFIWISGSLVVAVAFFEIIAAKVMLAICLCTAPLFLILTLFDKTRPLFDRWLGVLIGYSLVLIFVSTVVGLSVSLIHACVAPYIATEASNIRNFSWVPIFFVSALCMGALFQAAHIAKHIGGACHSAGGSAMMGGLISGAMGGAMYAAQANKAWQQLRGVNKKNGG